jgi:hypothetical protein
MKSATYATHPDAEGALEVLAACGAVSSAGIHTDKPTPDIHAHVVAAYFKEIVLFRSAQCSGSRIKTFSMAKRPPAIVGEMSFGL